MPGGSRTPIEKWPTRQLVGIGIVIALIASFGLFVALRGAWSAWRRNDIGVVIGAIAVSIFFSVWHRVSLQIGKELLRRSLSRRRRASANSLDHGATAKEKPEGL